MDKKTQDLAWACLPKEARDRIKIAYKSDYVSDKGYQPTRGMEVLQNVFGSHNLTSDAEPSEFISAERVKVDALQSEIFKEIMDAHDADDWQSVAHYILDVMPRTFASIFGSDLFK